LANHSIVVPRKVPGLDNLADAASEENLPGGLKARGKPVHRCAVGVKDSVTLRVKTQAC